MIKKGTRLSLFLTAVLGFLSISVGRAAFQTGENGATDSYDGRVTLRKAVCYISGSPNVYYPSIEKALKVAENTSGSQTVYVIPGANPTIKGDCTIASGDSLILPYADDGTTHTYHQYLEQSPTLAYKSGTLVTKVTIADGFTLTNNGTLTIGAIQNTGSGGNLYSGNATKSYTEIFLEGAAKVVNAGTMYAYGYIASDPANTTASVVMNSGSNTYAPFTVMEHRGGSIFVGMSSSDVSSLITSAIKPSGTTADLTCFPFNRMFVDCFLNVDYSFKSGAFLYGLAALYADSTTNTTTMSLIGNTSTFLFNLAANALFNGRFATSEDKHNIETKGSFSLHPLFLNLEVKKSVATAKIKLSSANVLLPISYHFNFKFSPFEDGAAAKVNTTAQGIKLLPGSRVEIGANVTLNASSIAVYRNDDLYPNGKYIVTGSVGANPYPSKNDAQFVVNGILQATNCGGLLLTENPGASAIISSSTEVDSSEIISTSPASVSIIGIMDMNYSKPAYLTIMKSASGYCANHTYVSSSETAYEFGERGEKGLSVGTAYSSVAVSENCVWNYSGNADYVYGIRYSLGLSSASVPEGAIESFASYGGNVTLLPPVSNDANYSLDGLYYDPSFTPANKLPIGIDGNPYLDPSVAMNFLAGRNYINLYAKWNDLSAGSYTVSLISMVQASNKQAIVESSPTTPQEVPATDTYTLQNRAGNQIYSYSSINASAGTGVFNLWTFAGYTIEIRDATNALVDTVSVDVNGNSPDGSKVQGFEISPEACAVSDGYSLVATEVYSNQEIAYALTISPDSTSTLSQNSTRVFTLNVDSAISSRATLSFAWTKPSDVNVPLTTDSNINSQSVKVKNEYKESEWFGSTNVDVSISCSVSDGNLVLASSVSYTFKVVQKR